MIKCFVTLIIYLTLSSIGFSKCNFSSAEHIEALRDPGEILKIDVKVPKSGKFAKNFLKISTSKSYTIPANLKKNFKADIKVTYKFGVCAYKGRIRQSGDGKDHIKFTGGMPLRSLDIKLSEGNIVGAVRFKLLIPETRNGKNEVLGALILKELGFISPETFEVAAIINGVSANMLFQENAEKELLERNDRREGPMFEGDESLLWSYMGREEFSLKELALSRLTNKDWFLKGSSSQRISLNAYLRLQLAYLESRANPKEKKGIFLRSNTLENEIFSNYFYAVLAMNGSHALNPHNARFYFNSFLDSFEPIFYDGNLNFQDEVILDNVKLGQGFDNSFDAAFKGYLGNFFYNGFNTNFTDLIKNLTNSKSLKWRFLARVKLSDHEAEKFFLKSINIFINNSSELAETINETHGKNSIVSPSKVLVVPLDAYLESQKRLGILQRLVRDIKQDGPNFDIALISGKRKKVDANFLSEMISVGSKKVDRHILVGAASLKYDLKNRKRLSPDFPGEIFSSPKVGIDIDNTKKNITILQKNPKDWVLIRKADMDGWTVYFNGTNQPKPKVSSKEQRFNLQGLTGCLNFYETSFKNSSLISNGGLCEDSINIVKSIGKIDHLTVREAAADAIDIDFSNLNIRNINVDSAGNDCLDVSGGFYTIETFLGNDCGDKGISVGEMSELTVDKAEVTRALLGVSSKDLSNVEIKDARFSEVINCFEAVQKKQEFGGGSITLSQLNCEGDSFMDDQSYSSVKIK